MLEERANKLESKGMTIVLLLPHFLVFAVCPCTQRLGHRHNRGCWLGAVRLSQVDKVLSLYGDKFKQDLKRTIKSVVSI